MTVIIGTVSSTAHMTSSDGRTRTNKGMRLDSETFNKTFSLYNGIVRGAFANNMNFVKKEEPGISRSIGDHISKIIPEIIPPSFQDLVEIIKNGLVNLLQNALSPSMEERGSILFLTGPSDLAGGELVFYRILFEPVIKGTILGPRYPVNNLISFFEVPPIPGVVEAIQNVFESPSCQNCLNIEELRICHEKALLDAIAICEKEYQENPKYGGEICSVGGNLFFQPPE